MAKLYSETNQTGNIKTWMAAKRLVCDNLFNALPTVTVNEVERTTLDNELINEKSVRTLFTQMNNPGRRVPYINPDTYEQILDSEGKAVIGQSFTAEQIVYALACLYIDMSINNEVPD
jgi:hypothetical protein